MEIFAGQAQLTDYLSYSAKFEKRKRPAHTPQAGLHMTAPNYTNLATPNCFGSEATANTERIDRIAEFIIAERQFDLRLIRQVGAGKVLAAFVEDITHQEIR